MACGCALPGYNPGACCRCPNAVAGPGSVWPPSAYGPVIIAPQFDYKKAAEELAKALEERNGADGGSAGK